MSEKNLFTSNTLRDRRKFIKKLSIIGMTLVADPLWVKAASNNEWTVRQIIDLFIKEVPGSPFKDTVDTLKSGSYDTKVTGIVTTMFATIEVIKKTISLGANFIIAHEPTFYNHQDETAWLEHDSVYNYKMDLLKKHNIAVWRNHDYIHKLNPDGVKTGVLAQLKWQKYYDPKVSGLVMVPDITLKDLITQVKERLGIVKLRYIGDLSKTCRKILLMPGAAGGMRQIEAISKEKPDVLVCGEVSEWETAEYVRDARAKGENIALIVLGHIASEEPGSQFMATWLQEHVKGIKVTHVPPGNSLSFG